jgi:hypothetical protein
MLKMQYYNIILFENLSDNFIKSSSLKNNTILRFEIDTVEFSKVFLL